MEMLGQIEHSIEQSRPLQKSLIPAMTSGISVRPRVSIYVAALRRAGLG